MTPKERVIAQIEHKETDFIPYTLYFEEDWDGSIKDGVLEQVNSYYGNNSWRDKIDNHIIQVPTVNFGVDYESGKTISTDMYGTQWRVNKRPMHVERPALEKPTLSGYKFPNLNAFFDEGWYERVLQLIDEKKDYFLGATRKEDYFLVTSIGFGLFERSWNMRGFENALIDSIANPDFYQELIERIFEQQMMLLDRLLTLPLDGILLGDDFAYQNGIMIGVERWRKYFKPYLAKMYAKIHQAGKYTLHHMCGSEAEILPELIEIGLDVYESVQPEAKNNSPYRLKKMYGKNITFWGGLGSQSTIPFGTPSEIKLEVSKLCKEMGKGGGYILECAKPIQPETPTENVVAVIEAFAEQAGISI